MSKTKISYLTHLQEVSMILSRFLRDVDSLRHLLSIWIIEEDKWNREFYLHLYQYHNDQPSIIDRHFLLFDIQHFYPRFLSELNCFTKFYEDMPINTKVKLLKKLNEDEETIHMRRKSIYLFQRNRVDEALSYPKEHMIHQNSAKYLVGVMNYNG